MPTFENPTSSPQRNLGAHLMTATHFQNIRSIRDLPIAGKRLFMRLDLNVPLQGNKIEDDSRIREALPTIKHAIAQGAKIVIASHLGRPDGKRNPAFSLEPVAHYLAELLAKEDTTTQATEVLMADDCIGEGIELLAQSLKPGQILMLENLRFHAEEEANDAEFSHRLSRLGEIYITDAFGTAHRKHASTFGVPSVMQTRGMGFLIEKELLFLDRLLHTSEKPFYAILGGSKVSDKIKTIESLLRRVDGLLIGGAMANAFWLAQGDTLPVGAKQPKPDDIEAARVVMREAKKRDLPLLIPSDTNQGFDIGEKTIEQFKRLLANARTVFWNGPLGWFEKPEFAKGTTEIAQFVGSLKATKVLGGGDTVFAVRQAGLATQFDHCSTGGGAVLEYLEGEGLPGIDVLKSYSRVATPEPLVLN